MVFAHKLHNPSQKYILDPDKPELENAHILLSGGSGSGKTYTLKRIMDELKNKGKFTVVIDYHGDLETPGENLIKFSYAENTHAINPFELEIDEEQGGVKTQTEVILRILAEYFFTKGRITKKQENLLEEIILDTYAAKGIFHNKPETWNKPVPTMKDLGNVFEYISAHIEGRGGAEFESGEIVALERIQQKIANIKDEVRSIGFLKETPELEDILKKADELENTVSDIAINERMADNNPQDKTENSSLDFSKIKIEYYQKEGNVKSFLNLYNYVYKVSNIGFFGNNLPKLKRGINRIDLSAFTSIGKPLVAKLISELLMQKFFRSAMLRGEYQYSKSYMPNTKFDRAIIIDESKIALPSGAEKKDPFNIINRIVTEARKFGVSIILASQRIDHYSGDMLSNISVKVILGAKAIDYASIGKAIGMNQNIIKNAFCIKNKRIAIISEDGVSDVWEIESKKD